MKILGIVIIIGCLAFIGYNVYAIIRDIKHKRINKNNPPTSGNKNKEN